MNEQQLTESLHRVRDDIVVGPPPVLQVHNAAARRRRRIRVGVAVTAAAAVAVVGATVALHDRRDSTAPEPAVRLIENPAPVAWWGDGWLHVAHAVVELPKPDFIQPVGDGVVVWTQGTPGGTGAPVVHVADDGTTSTLAEKTDGWKFASDVTTGWVAWVDHPTDTPPALVVYDTRTGKEVGRHEVAEDGPRHEVLDEGPYPLSIEDGVVYYADWDADYRWDVASGEAPEAVTDSATYLVDREAGVEMTRTYDEHGYSAPTVGPAGGAGAELPYWAFTLSPDGLYVAGGTSIGPEPRLYDLAAEHAVPTGIDASRPFLASAFGADGTLTYAFGTVRRVTQEEIESGPIDGAGLGAPFSLVTCEIATASCTTVVDDIGGDEGVVLPD